MMESDMAAPSAGYTQLRYIDFRGTPLLSAGLYNYLKPIIPFNFGKVRFGKPCKQLVYGTQF